MEPTPTRGAEPSEMDRQLMLKLVRQLLATWQEDRYREYRRIVIGAPLASLSLWAATWLCVLLTVAALAGCVGAAGMLLLGTRLAVDYRPWTIAAAVGLPFVALLAHASYVAFASIRRLRSSPAGEDD